MSDHNRKLRELLECASTHVKDESLLGMIQEALSSEEPIPAIDPIRAAEKAAFAAGGVFVKASDYTPPPGIIGYVRKTELEEFLDSGASWNTIGLDHPNCWVDEPPYDHLIPIFANPQEAKEDGGRSEKWRNLALQFDRHRMQAMSMLAAVSAGNASKEDCEQFINQPPMIGTKIVKRLDALESEVKSAQENQFGVCMLVAEAAIKFARGTDRAVPSDVCKQIVLETIDPLGTSRQNDGLFKE